MSFTFLVPAPLLKSMKLDKKLSIPEIVVDLIREKKDPPIDYTGYTIGEPTIVGQRESHFNDFSIRLTPNNTMKEL